MLTAAIIAMLRFAGLAFADTSNPVKPIGPGSKIAKPIAVSDDEPTNPSGDNLPAAANSAFAAPPANDTCAGAIPLTLNRTTKGTTVDANNDYQTPATAACYSGVGQTPTTAPGRDVVYSFTAPADGKYSFRIIQQSPLDVIRTQNEVLYLTDCANAGTVNCLAGANRPTSAAFVSSTGASNNQSEEVACYPMTFGQTVYVVFDDGAPGVCTNNNHACFTDSDCTGGGTCTPTLNPGGVMSLEPIVCNSEVEPNDTPATASPLFCGSVGTSDVAPVGHCYLGTRAGQVCTRSSFLEQTLPNAKMRCSISGNPCAVDLATGVGNCAAGEGLCQSLTDLDCDPRCDIGPNAGRTCGTQAFCNPGSDQGATCGGTCQVESTCIVTATGADSGVACTPVCVGSSIPSVNGRYCSALSGCPGAGVCTETPLVPTPGATCVAGQVCSRQFNEGDTDYYFVGAPPAGSKVFVGSDAKTANDYDFRMRVTTASNTLQMDDDDVTSRGGANAPCIAGAVTDGSDTYVEVSRTTPRTSATYELYTIVRPPLAAALVEDESGPTGNDIYFGWPGDVVNANYTMNSGGYVRGSFQFQGDSDCFKFLVNEGDLMDWFGDGGPGRTNLPVSSVNVPQPIVYDAEPAGISNFGFGNNPRKNLLANVQGPGLRALSPAVTSSYFQWRASYTGMLEVCYYDASAFIGQGTPAHPSAWAGSLSVNCGPLQPAGPGTTTADVSIAKTGPPGPVQPGAFVTYAITTTNHGTEIAQEVRLADTLDPNFAFVGLTVDDGFAGNNTACFSLPTQGANDAPIDCINTSMAPGATTTYVLTVHVNNCIGSRIDIANTASITTVSTDPDPSNDQATATFTTSDDGSCTDIVCDGVTCFADLCTANDHCETGVCVTSAVTCDDQNLCTDDSCSPAVGCVYDSTNLGDLCDDFTECTTNACDPLLFCVFPPAPAGSSCDDGLACTGAGATDQCDGLGTCAGLSVCDDGSPCTDDFADEINLCACSHVPWVAGTACSDSNVCTTSDTCNAVGACLGGPALGCVADADACTADGCDPASGCVHKSANLDPSSFSVTRVDGRDLVVLADAWNSCSPDTRYDAAADLDPVSTPPGACVDMDDFHIFMTLFGRSCP
jgi:uncharacterized repeat protein (TIGR01451 family)